MNTEKKNKKFRKEEKKIFKKEAKDKRDKMLAELSVSNLKKKTGIPSESLDNSHVIIGKVKEITQNDPQGELLQFVIRSKGKNEKQNHIVSAEGNLSQLGNMGLVLGEVIGIRVQTINTGIRRGIEKEHTALAVYCRNHLYSLTPKNKNVKKII